jgi:hypothetical protein
LAYSTISRRQAAGTFAADGLIIGDGRLRNRRPEVRTIFDDEAFSLLSGLSITLRVVVIDKRRMEHQGSDIFQTRNLHPTSVSRN